MKSWGETITVAVAGTDGNVAVDVTIASRMPTTLIDWGQSADELKRFGDWIMKTQTPVSLPPEMIEEIRKLIDATRSAVADLQAVAPAVPKRTSKKTLD
jgi:hypothetical protein